MVSELVKTVNHLLPVRDEQVHDRHIHIARLKGKACHQRSELHDFWRLLNDFFFTRVAFDDLLCLEDLLTHLLQLVQHVVPLLLGNVDPLLYTVHLVVDVVVKLLIEFVLNRLLEVVIVELLLVVRVHWESVAPVDYLHVHYRWRHHSVTELLW